MRILKVNQKNLKEVTEKVQQLVKEGKVIICPTDTVYGLVCDATNIKAVRRFLKIKRRPKNKPIPIFVKNLKMAKKLAKIDKKQEKILKAVWPGKATTVLKRTCFRKGFGGRGKIRLYGVDKKTIALRLPDYKLLNVLLKKLNCPLAETSANISGRPTLTKIKEIIKQFKSQKYQPDLAIDAGNLLKSRPSVVLDLTSWPPKILRI